jgi:hypothetical protein
VQSTASASCAASMRSPCQHRHHREQSSPRTFSGRSGASWSGFLRRANSARRLTLASWSDWQQKGITCVLSRPVGEAQRCVAICGNVPAMLGRGAANWVCWCSLTTVLQARFKQACVGSCSHKVICLKYSCLATAWMCIHLVHGSLRGLLLSVRHVAHLLGFTHIFKARTLLTINRCM